jgi:hypothetical protein
LALGSGWVQRPSQSCFKAQTAWLKIIRAVAVLRQIADLQDAIFFYYLAKK